MSSSSGSGTVPSLNIDLYAPELLPDPWAQLARIREAGPIVWNEQGYWMTARHRTCREMLSNPGTFGQEGLIASLFGQEAFISINDKALHNSLRNVWVSTFGHQGVASLVGFVREVIDEMLADAIAMLEATGSVDIMAALCRPLPAYVIARMMGVEGDMIPAVIRWSDLMADATSGGFPIDYENDPAWLASEAAKAELAQYIRDQIRFRRANPGQDLISTMVHSEVASRISDEAMMVNIRQLLFAGNETTSKWLGHIVVTFGDRPDVRQALREEPGLVPAALEEVMRWQGVTQVLPRGVGREGIEIEGARLPPGAEVILLLGAAGRDPDRWDNPDAFDIYREPKPHLGFGFGMHSCLGAGLARMEAREVANAVLQRFPDFRIRRPVTFCNFSLRGPTSVIVARA